MSEPATLDTYGRLTEPTTLTIERLLPGPMERVWAWLTESELRRQWLAAGEMEMKVGAPFTFTWRNDELSDPPGRRPEGFSAEHSMESRIVECAPPHRLSFTWEGSGDVTFALQPKGSDVLLTVTHRRLPSRKFKLGVSTGWHAHLDVLAKRMAGKAPPPFWDGFTALRADYDRRLPA